MKFGSEDWVLKKREEQRLEAVQMKFLRHLLGITKIGKEKNQCIRQKTEAKNIVKEIKQYQKKWLQHVQRMGTERLPKQALQYKANVATTCTEDGHRLPKQALQYKANVATTCTEDGHKQTTKRSTTI